MERRRNGSLIYLAMLTMLIDHIGLLFFPQITLFRSIGRIAFPIFAWGIAKGFHYTSDRRAYFKRLLLFALLSQLPYSFLTPGLEWRPFAFNQIAQFVLSFLVLLLLEKAKREKIYYLPGILLIFIPDALRLYFPEFSIGYGSYGILLSVLFYEVKGPAALGIGYLFISIYGSYSSLVSWYQLSFFSVEAMQKFILYLGSTQLTHLSGLFSQWKSIFALPFILFEDNLPKLPLHKWTAYVFYPLHMAVLILLYRLLSLLGVL